MSGPGRAVQDAREVLDAAIRAYVAVTDQPVGGTVVTDYVLIAASLDATEVGCLSPTYTFFESAAQPHVNIGLLAIAMRRATSYKTSAH